MTTSTITQYETEVSVCLVQGTQYPFKPRPSPGAGASPAPVEGGQVGASAPPVGQRSAPASRQEAAANDSGDSASEDDLGEESLLEQAMDFFEGVMGGESD